MMMILAGALLALLPVLAVLQYRWLTEVSEAERKRMKENLQVSAGQFCQEFDRELTQVYLHFLPSQMGATEAGAEEKLAAEYRSWTEQSAHPKLIGAIYELRFAAEGEAAGERLLRFDPGAGRFAPAEWPPELSGLRASIGRLWEERRQAKGMLQEVFSLRERLLGEGRAPKGQVMITRQVSPTVIHLSTGPADGSIPGLVIPLFEDNPAAHSPLPMPMPTVYRVIALDPGYLQQTYFSELIARHFTKGAGGLEYRVAIVPQGGGGAPIYRSGGEALPEKPDVSEGFFRVRMNQADRMLLAGRPASPPAPPAPSAPSGALVTRSERRSVASIFIQSDVNVNGQGGGKPVGAPLSEILNAREEGRWRVLVQHRAGSLEAAVAATHRRNLAISFGILLLMGISVGLIVLSSRRAQRLAERQMEFVAGVSHELRTPLAVICSAAENLADGVIANREQIQRYGGLIRDEGRRLTGMVEQVLEYAGAQSGRKNYDMQPVELRRVLDDALAACHLQRVEGGFEIVTRIPETLPVVTADAAALSRALQNLLANAMKYSGESRWVGLEVEIARGERGDEVRMAVADRGIGISPQDLPHIFESFYRGAEVAAAQIHGNGLGLSLVKHIVAAHGGRVTVESRPGEGSRFTIHLPAAAMPPAAEASQANYEQTHPAR